MATKHTAFAAFAAFGAASSAFAINIPLGNLLDDPKGTPLATALASDTYGAGASTSDLGVIARIKGGLGGNTVIAPGITFNTSAFGGANTNPSTVPTNDRVVSAQSQAISTLGSLQLNPPANKLEDGIGLWGDQVLSFDLDEIRAAGGLAPNTEFGFSAQGGINDYAGETASMRVAVIVSSADGVIAGYLNGQAVAVTLSGGVYAFSGGLPAALSGSGQRLADFNFNIPGNARYVSLVAVSLGDGFDQDQGVFSGATLLQDTVPAPGGIAVFGLGALAIARRRRAL